MAALVVTLLAVMLTVAAGPTTPVARAQVPLPSIEPNLVGGARLLGPSVVLSGMASSPVGIDQVLIVVENAETGRFASNSAGATSATLIEISASTALLPPLGDPAVSWRVPLSLGEGTWRVVISALDADGGRSDADPIEFEVVAQPVPDITLISAGSSWAYQDDGSLPPDTIEGDISTTWLEPGYDDSAWPSGPAPLGFGEDDVVTTTNATSVGADGVVTQYFRHVFVAPDLTAHPDAAFRLRRDDGAIVYLNGVEIARTNMADGVVGPATPALGESDQLLAIPIDSAVLVAGDNVVAVELHRFGIDSPTMAFDIELVATPSERPLVADDTPGTYVLAAGDMAHCSYDGDRLVAEQMGELFDSDAGVFIGLGDLAYNSGTFAEYVDCYEPTIGRFKEVTWPAPGNHEHYTAPNAAGYRQYFGPAAGPDAGPAGGLWYSFDIDDNWHVVALDSDCRGREVLPGAIDGNGCAVGSTQEQWLRADLEANQDKSVLAFFHHPPFTNNRYVDHGDTWPLWRALTEFGADITLHGHEHHYERYAKIDYWGDRDATYGTREFIVGTGGLPPRYEQGPQADESDFRGTFPIGTSDFGVLQLWLQPDGYEWKWESIYGLAPVDQGTSALTEAMPRADLFGVVDEPAGLESAVEICAVADRTGVETCTATTEGGWRLGPLVSDAYAVTARFGEADGGSTQASLEAPTDTEVEILIDLGASITGTVTGEAGGAPIALATVCATSSSDGAITCANTDTAGSYELVGLQPGQYTVDYAATGFITECYDDHLRCESSEAVPVAGIDVAAIDASLDLAGGTINGTVRSADRGGVLAGVLVCATRLGFASEHCGTSEADGSWSVGDLPTGNYTVAFVDQSGMHLDWCHRSGDCSRANPVGVIAPGVVVGIDAALDTNPEPPPTPTVEATPTPEPTSPPLAGGGVVTGQITELNTGQPIFGIRVCVSRSFPLGEWCRYTQADGSYRIDELQSGNVAVTVSDPALRFVENCYGNRVCTSPEIFGVWAGSTVAGVDIAVDSLYSASNPTPAPAAGLGSIEGAIAHAGSPIAGVEVCAQSMFDATMSCAITAADGAYSITGLTTANYRVEVGGGEWCYVASIDCGSPTPVGVVSPMTRTSIDLDFAE